LEAYEAWLNKEGYQPSTIAVSVRLIGMVFDNVDGHPDYCEAHIRRYLRFVEKTRKNPLGKRFTGIMRLRGFEAAADIRKHGNRSKKLLHAGNWMQLRAKLRRGDEISRLLVAYMQSPYRISDFLKLRANSVTSEDVRDKISRDWIRDKGGRQPLYKLLCNTERCAYSRMRKRLQQTCKKMGLDADFDTLYKSFQVLEAA
jgi:hypothetical protein